MLTSADFESIYAAIESRVDKKGESFLTSKVIKNDPVNSLVWVAELGDQPIPVFTFDLEMKYYDTADIVGTIKTISGVRIPEAYMLAIGTSLLRTDYPDLFNEIGTRYGSVDATHFTLPDMRSKFIYGQTAGDLSDVGTTGGEATHLLTPGETAIRDHVHYAEMGSGATAADLSDRAARHATSVDSSVFPNLVKGVQGGAVNASSAHNNLPPYVLMAYIIKVTGAPLTEKKAKISISIPEVGDTVLVALERGTKRLPRCLGKLQSENYIQTTLDEA